MNFQKPSLFSLVFFLLGHFCSASTDHVTISPEQPIKDGDTLISSGQVFALGFFSPANSSHRYVGIWYNKVSVQTIVWVANRDTPVTDTTGVLAVTPQGNLVLLAGNRSIWSSNISSTTNNPRAHLLDSGNLVLVKNDSRTVMWQSFDHPTDTYLPYMKLGLNRRTGLSWVFTSWRSENDPGTGNYSYAIDPTGYPQLFLYKGPDPWWRVGSWTGLKWSGVPEMTHNFIFNVSYVDNQDEISVLYGVTDSSILSRMVIEGSGFVRRSTWNPRGRRWIEFWYDPKEQCDYYKQCGINSICDPYNSESFQCKCLPGFEPKLPREWNLRDGSGGCVRNQEASICNNGEGFYKVAHVKVPDTKFVRVNMSLNLKDCELECKRNCSCKAYTSADERGIGCMTWHGDLVDSRKYSDLGQDLYVRVDSAMLVDKHILHKKWMIALLVIVPAILLALAVTFVYRMVTRKTKGSERQMRYSFSFTASSGFLEDSSSGKKQSESGENGELPIFFDLSTIAAATNNFSFVNKLGQGGFGPVYKGHLLNGKDIAVKRLSEHSGQGAQEFKNEVSLIAKLQHRNLVKILGCCIQEKEKMLIYEYLPNKSLDFFLFDEAKRSLLDWRKRFSIVYGVARGILYLHEDSRLRIIHRDLKASNVLLDEAMNPKISDFGMARIFGGDQIEGSTNRVVGTYGYMSPEYAMEGLFSIKSDVFSFGVLVLEIVSGKRNSGYFHDNPSLNLIRHVWELWREGRAMEIVDEAMGGSYEKEEVVRCIQIGLLCVQESAAERPTMSSVVFMLGNDSTSDQLPSPNQPAFSFKTYEKKGATSSSSNSSQGPCSANYLTHSLVEPR